MPLSDMMFPKVPSYQLPSSTFMRSDIQSYWTLEIMCGQQQSLDNPLSCHQMALCCCYCCLSQKYLDITRRDYGGQTPRNVAGASPIISTPIRVLCHQALQQWQPVKHQINAPIPRFLCIIFHTVQLENRNFVLLSTELESFNNIEPLNF